jgi:dolichol-phosphate mannosyltransferase
MKLSIVLPCYNEAENIPRVHRRLAEMLDGLGCEGEILFVDDGSRDDSVAVLAEICRRDSRVRVLEFSRNFGHQAAICAGLDHAAGDAVVTLDADLQHPPELIPEMVDRWREGCEIVYTVRQDPPDLPRLKRWTSRGFYRLINLVIREKIPENAADFRLMDRKVVAEFRRLPERTKFLRGLVSWMGFRQCALPYEAGRRSAGAPKYNLWKMVRFALDGITSFSAFPLHVATFFGILVSFMSFLYGLYVIGVKLFTRQAVPGWASVMVAVLFLGGVQLICLGIIGGYLNRVFIEVKHRPTYVIRSTRGFPLARGES